MSEGAYFLKLSSVSENQFFLGCQSVFNVIYYKVHALLSVSVSCSVLEVGSEHS